MATHPQDDVEQTKHGVTPVPLDTDTMLGPDSRLYSIKAQLHSQSLPLRQESPSHKKPAQWAYVDRFDTPISPDAYHEFFRPTALRERRDSADQQEAARPAASTLFPVRLYNMLEDAESHGFETIVSWQSHGRAFAIHDRNMFEQEIMPR